MSAPAERPSLKPTWGPLLAEAACRALLVLARSARDPDLAHFTGPIHLGRSLLVLPASGAPRLGFLSPMEREEAAATGLALLPPEELEVLRAHQEGWPEAQCVAAAARAALAACGIAPGRLALAGQGAVGESLEVVRHLEAAGWEPVDGTEIARRVRKAKGPVQLDGLRRAARGAEAAFRRVAALLAAASARSATTDGELWLEGERLTVGRLRSEVARTLAEHGLEQPAGNILAPGRDAGIPHSAGRDDRILRSGESLVVDLYPAAPPFADCTRTFCVGRPPEALARAHAAVLEALRGAHRGARPGGRGWDLQVEACRVLGEAGYPTPLSDPESIRGYVHNLGHGVGFELHEYPSFRKHSGAEGLLEPGDVLTLEPGLYEPVDGWGVRLEDLVHLPPDAPPEVLTRLPYDLDPRAWEPK